MVNLTGLQSQIERIDILLITVLAVIEIGIDLAWYTGRNYRDTRANLTIAFGYSLINTIAGYGIAFSGLKFFSQFSLWHIAPNVWTMILAIAIADFLYYWQHRTEHRIRFFWAYHNVHHSSTDYNLTVAARLSWVEVCFVWIFYIPMALLGFDVLQIFIAIEITAIYQIWIHTQKIGRLGFLEKIVNTPALHRVHHGSNHIYIDKNFGAIFMIWDRLFGTYQIEKGPVIYGLTENINTNNLIKINAIEYRRMRKYISHSKSLREIFYSVFGNLEWKPEKLKH